MDRLTPQDIDHLAHLARLRLTDAERDRFARELTRILAYVAQLSAIDTQGLDLRSDASEIETAAAVDAVRPFPLHTLQEVSPLREGFFRAPRLS